MILNDFLNIDIPYFKKRNTSLDKNKLFLYKIVGPFNEGSIFGRVEVKINNSTQLVDLITQTPLEDIGNNFEIFENAQYTSSQPKWFKNETFFESLTLNNCYVVDESIEAVLQNVRKENPNEAYIKFDNYRVYYLVGPSESPPFDFSLFVLTINPDEFMKKFKDIISKVYAIPTNPNRFNFFDEFLERNEHKLKEYFDISFLLGKTKKIYTNLCVEETKVPLYIQAGSSTSFDFVEQYFGSRIAKLVSNVQ